MKPDLKDSIEQSVREARDKILKEAKIAASTVQGEVKDNPWTYIGIVALISAILGFFLGRKSKD